MNNVSMYIEGFGTIEVSAANAVEFIAALAQLMEKYATKKDGTPVDAVRLVQKVQSVKE